MSVISSNLKQLYSKHPKTGCTAAMVIVGYDAVSELHHYFETTCNRWSCISCGPWKTRDLCKRTAEAKPNRFITLTTANHKTQTPREVWNFARRQVPELIRWIRKHRGPCEYVRVLEEHKSGYPHFHLIVRGPYIGQSALSDQWCKLTKAFIVDIQKINPEDNVAQYIAKYLTKQMSRTFTDRRVTASKGFFLPKPEKPESELELFDVKRFKGGLEQTLYWEFPNETVEQVGPSHWIGTPHQGRGDDIEDDPEITPKPKTLTGMLREKMIDAIADGNW